MIITTNFKCLLHGAKMSTVMSIEIPQKSLAVCVRVCSGSGINSHLHEGRMDVVDLQKEGNLVDWESVVHRDLSHSFQGLVVAHGNAGVEVDTLCSWDW